MKALTSASSLVKEMPFSRYEFDKRRLARKIQGPKRIEGPMTEQQKKKLIEEEKRLEAKN